MIGAQPSPALTLQLDGVKRTLTDDSLLSDKRPKSPSRLGALFGWKSSPNKSGTESPTTTFSDRSSSPVPSPRYQKPLPMEPDGISRLTPPGLDIGKANASYFDHPTTPIYLNSSEGNAHVQDLERELSHISEELASSIRREMELEDELERLKLEMPTMPLSEAGRRSSDYFSDSGASSTKFPVSDVEAKIEHVERLRRKAEQEKAQVIQDSAQRLQTEMTKRRELEQLVQSLEEQMQDKSRNEDERLILTEKVTELEASLDETKRRLADEKKLKDNFEDLYSATRGDLEQGRNERDNLRDEIMPRLHNRVQILEVQLADHQALVHENTRMAQELNALKHEQSLFHEANRLGGNSMFDMIAEEKLDMVSPIIGSMSPQIGGPRTGLSRSGSLARSSSKTRGSLARSDSVKGREGGRQRSGSSGPLSAEAQKEIEDQRDALHKALKLLISRYEKQHKDHTQAIKKLNKEKKDADLRADASNPKRSHYTREVTFLKEEVNALRKRTEDALEQKWEYEKGLSGIKMDLDRAEQETRGLRHLLQEEDIVLTSPEAPADPAMDQLSFSISTAKSERDYARRMAEAFRQRALNLQETYSTDSSDDQLPPSVSKLFDSANSMDELAEQLDAQVRANVDLRSRLTEAVEKGEREQRESTRQVEEMQKRLAELEESVLAAAAHSENTLSTHEGEVRRLEEAASPLLKRLEPSTPDPSKLSPAPTTTPASSPMLGQGITPRLQPSSKLLANISSNASLQESSKTQTLEHEVRQMEFMLREAAAEMQRVVQRVHRGQDEVAELTGERDRAVSEMRRLKGLIAEEERKADAVA
jgi:chromosome segregation ATPase